MAKLEIIGEAFDFVQSCKYLCFQLVPDASFKSSVADDVDSLVASIQFILAYISMEKILLCSYCILSGKTQLIHGAAVMGLSNSKWNSNRFNQLNLAVNNPVCSVFIAFGNYAIFMVLPLRRNCLKKPDYIIITLQNHSNQVIKSL